MENKRLIGNKVTWPGGAQSAAMVTVEMDDRFIWLALSEEVGYDYDTPKNRSMGTYGTLRGLGRVLESLGRFSVRATFFVPGAFAAMHPERLREIVNIGHEIALHGYSHRNFARLSQSEQRDEILKASAAIEEAIGKKPLGFRLPEGNCTPETRATAMMCGMLYDNSFFDDDVPYVLSECEHEMVEIPMRWELQDFPYFAHGPRFPMGGGRIAAYDDVLDNWLTEIEAGYDEGLCSVMKFDPQIIGTPGRIFMLDAVLSRLTRGNIWVATGTEVASFVKEGAT
jgi:peptidoglycan/xylan/chitin deacetylase (PgdA/CDA1 family)